MPFNRKVDNKPHSCLLPTYNIIMYRSLSSLSAVTEHLRPLFYDLLCLDYSLPLLIVKAARLVLDFRVTFLSFAVRNGLAKVTVDSLPEQIERLTLDSPGSFQRVKKVSQHYCFLILVKEALNAKENFAFMVIDKHVGQCSKVLFRSAIILDMTK